MAATKVYSMFYCAILNNPVRTYYCPLLLPVLKKVCLRQISSCKNLLQFEKASKSEAESTQVNSSGLKHNDGTKRTVEEENTHEKIMEASFKIGGKRKDKLEDEFHTCGKLIYEDENIIAFNKPQGTSVFGPSEMINGMRCVPSSKAVPISYMIPDLAERFKCPDLKISLSLKSFYSGVLVLSKNNKVHQSMRGLVLTGAKGELYKSYLAITVGLPQCQHGVQMTAFILRKHLHDLELSDISDKDNPTARKQKRMIKVFYKVEPLVNNEELGVALVKVSISKDKWAAVECLLSHFLSPVLGDEIYSARTSSLMGVPIAVNSHTARPGPQKLPQPVSEFLTSDQSLPADICSRLHVHRYQVNLARVPRKNSKPLTITAPPTEHFLSVLKCLGLYRENMFGSLHRH